MKYYKIFFAVLILTLLILPLSHINRSEITEQENRTLAKFPALMNNGKINPKFGIEFNNWLNDRFWGRNQLINTRFQAIYKINGRIENEKAFIGDDGWMFDKGNTVNIPSIQKQREKIEKDAEILKKFADKFKGKNIPIYLVIIPDRDVLYQKYWERYYRPKLRLDYGGEMIKLLKDYPYVHAIYPKKEFEMAIQNKKDVFLKTDLHLNAMGEYLYKKAYGEKIKRDFLQGENVRLQHKEIRKEFGLSHYYYASLLGFPFQKKEEYGLNVFVDIPKGDDGKKKKEMSQKNNREITKVYYMYWINKNAPIDRIGAFIGTCYGQELFFIYENLFTESSTFNLHVKLSAEEKSMILQKMKELYELSSNSAIITLVFSRSATIFNVIRESLDESE